MNRQTFLGFQMKVLDIVEAEDCRTAEEYSNVSNELHEVIEMVIQDICRDEEIDYTPNY